MSVSIYISEVGGGMHNQIFMEMASDMIRSPRNMLRDEKEGTQKVSE